MDLQLPLEPLDGGFTAHDFSSQLAYANFPLAHTVLPLSLYPALHVGVHVAPAFRADEQSPTPPFAGALDGFSQSFSLHMALDSPSFVQVVLPEILNPVLQIGWHDWPSFKEEPQSPRFPFAGTAFEMSQDLMHVAAVNLPSTHLDLPETVKPL